MSNTATLIIALGVQPLLFALVESVNRADGTPIPWGALSGLAAGRTGQTIWAIDDSFLELKVSAAGVIEDIVRLPAAVNAKQVRFGFEGIAESNGRLVVAFQRAWAGETAARIGVYDLATKTWRFAFYPLESPQSPLPESWVGLSDITALGNDAYLVVERDNAAGPDARIERLYRFSLAGVPDGGTVAGKTLVRDLLPDLKATRGYVPEKIEGLAVLVTGEVLIVDDNDGVDDGANSGETQLLNLGEILK